MHGPEELEGGGAPLRFSLFTDVAFFFFGAVLVLLEFFFGVHRLFAMGFEFLKEQPDWIMAAGVYFVAGLLCLYGTRRVTTIIDPASKTVRRVHKLLLFLPVYTSSFHFGKIRYVDFDHPQSGVMPYSNAQIYFNYYWWGGLSFLFSGIADSAPYEIYFFLEDRSRILFHAGLGEKKMGETARKVAQTVGARLS